MTQLRPRNAAAERGNVAVIALISALWIAPTFRFWGAAFGPLRPFSYPADDVAPSLAAFAAVLAACFAPCLLPRTWYDCWEGGRGTRLYRVIGVRTFKFFATNGDLINRWARRLDPRYRLVRDEASARAWADQTRAGERSHLVLLLMGLATAGYAARIGWFGWAMGLTASSIVFHLYPVILQRYTRCRVAALLGRGVDASPRAR